MLLQLGTHCQVYVIGHNNLLMKFLFPSFLHQIITKEEANRRRMTILECEMNLPLPELRGSSELLEDIYIRKVSQSRFHILYLQVKKLICHILDLRRNCGI